MRRGILSMFVTLDGFISGPNGELDWMPGNEGARRCLVPLPHWGWRSSPPTSSWYRAGRALRPSWPVRMEVAGLPISRTGTPR